ncbi:hypothetical protein M9H77_02530 [Catharanthus roseus]|uniref:Uncharacterized protein n=1 Tax=Catharanthus roseus TaxID=4058 RepID=A0ACC0C924_CATRO|nr:hypothetical protein M9H77_02530 [Catharanthus roseus]
MASSQKGLRRSCPTANSSSHPTVAIGFGWDNTNTIYLRNPHRFLMEVLSLKSSIEVLQEKEILDSNTQSIANLEARIGHLANEMSRRTEGKLPSNPIENLGASYHEQAKAVITLREEN